MSSGPTLLSNPVNIVRSLGSYPRPAACNVTDQHVHLHFMFHSNGNICCRMWASEPQSEVTGGGLAPSTTRRINARCCRFLFKPSGVVLCVQLADQFCNAIGVLQQCAPPASFSNIQTAINKDQPANPTEGQSFVITRSYHRYLLLCLLINRTCLWRVSGLHWYTSHLLGWCDSLFHI